MVKTMSDAGGLGKIWDLTITGMQLVTSLSFNSLMMSLTQPSPKDSQRSWSGTRAEQRPQRHFHSARIRRRHDADLVVRGDFEQFARQLDRLLELDLADLGAMGAAERCVLEIFGRSSRGALRRDRRKNAARPAAERASLSS